MAMLFSCENDIKTIRQFTQTDTLPDEVIRDFEMVYTDSGQTTFKISSPILYSFNGTEPKMIFPQGLFVQSFDGNNNLKTSLKANYGINYPEKKIMEVRNNVIVENTEKGEQLNTEFLIWNQRTKKIYTDAFIKIRTTDKILFGKGLEADEGFRRRIVRQISGEILVNADE
jgi:LPS export ABC transporter protein LptC